MTKEEAIKAALGDINPMKHAGEAWTATEEIARPADIFDAYLRGEVMDEGAYYPGPDFPKSRIKRRY